MRCHGFLRKVSADNQDQPEAQARDEPDLVVFIRPIHRWLRIYVTSAAISIDYRNHSSNGFGCEFILLGEAGV